MQSIQLKEDKTMEQRSWQRVENETKTAPINWNQLKDDRYGIENIKMPFPVQKREKNTQIY